MGLMEGSASAMTLGLFLMSPLQPSKVGGEPEDTKTLLSLWFITFVFEVILPEGVIGFMSQRLSRKRGEHHFGDGKQSFMVVVGWALVADAPSTFDLCSLHSGGNAKER